MIQFLLFYFIQGNPTRLVKMETKQNVNVSPYVVDLSVQLELARPGLKFPVPIDVHKMENLDFDWSAASDREIQVVPRRRRSGVGRKLVQLFGVSGLFGR